MLFTDTTPRLKVAKTVSDPTDPASTLGFEGRNTLLGLDALILTDEATDEDIADADYAFLIPEGHGEAIREGDKHLYVLCEETVYGYTPDTYYGGHAETSIDGEVFHVVEPDDAAAEWDRDAVEVSN